MLSIFRFPSPSLEPFKRGSNSQKVAFAFALCVLFLGLNSGFLTPWTFLNFTAHQIPILWNELWIYERLQKSKENMLIRWKSNHTYYYYYRLCLMVKELNLHVGLRYYEAATLWFRPIVTSLGLVMSVGLSRNSVKCLACKPNQIKTTKSNLNQILQTNVE